MLTRLARGSVWTLAAALLLGACTHQEPPAPEPVAPTVPPEAEDEPGSREGGTLRIGLSTEPGSLDPRFVVDETGELIVDALFDPLVRIDDEGTPTPAAAREWEVDAEGRVFRFHLRDATFHDGTAVTAEDFVRSFRRIADGTAEPASFLAYLLEAVEGAEEARDGEPLRGVEALDEDTLEIRLSAADPGFLTTLSDPSLVPLPAASDSDPEAFALQPIGNGPFAMAGPREPGAFVRLTSFVDHPDPAYLDEVVFTMYDDLRGLERQWNDLLAGQLHVADLSPARRNEAEQRFGISPDGYTGPGVIDGITSAVYLYGIDTSTAPFDDPRVRRALSLAIDREVLAEDVMQGTRVAATSLVPPVIPGYRPAFCGYCRHDPDAAAALLASVHAELETPEEDADSDPATEDAEAGAEDAEPAEDADPAEDEDPVDGDDGEPQDADDEAAAPVLLEQLTLTHTRGDTHIAIAEQMAADIAAALDIEVDFQARDLESMIQSVREGDVPMFRLGWEVTTPDPGAYLRPLFHSSQIGLDNLSRYSSPRVDELLDEAQALDDPGQRAARFRAAERQILADLPVLPVLWYRHSAVVATEVQGFVYSPLGRMNLEEVWFDVPAS